MIGDLLGFGRLEVNCCETRHRRKRNCVSANSKVRYTLNLSDARIDQIRDLLKFIYWDGKFSDFPL